jgi:oleate hydratase
MPTTVRHPAPSAPQESDRAHRNKTKAYLIGAGIASLASAAYLIRDGGLPGQNICVYDETDVTGGSLDGEGSPEHNYVIRGGRMFTEEAYTCMFDLLSFIPSLTAPGKSVKEEIYEFNALVKSHSHSRLVKGGRKIDASAIGLSNKDRLDLIAIMAKSEQTLGAKRIEDLFEPSFFKTNFWYMWCTTFAFQPWHSAVELKRYLLRFIQEFPRIHTLAGVRRTPYNQYDSIVLPVTKWLKDRGVQFVMGSTVTGLDFKYGSNGKAVERIHYLHNGAQNEISVGAEDLVFVTNGSMTAASSLGSMTSPPGLGTKEEGGSWKLWEVLAKDHSDFGRPSSFNGNVTESKWLSFTATLRDPTFFNLMEQFTGNSAGTGGLVTFTDSNWLMSVVLPYQPHFINQPKDVNVFWGYGLFPDEEGNFVKKKMSECTGEEILRELWHQLRFDDQIPLMLKTANCIPCMMPFITSQFMPRVNGDRPLVRPTGTTNIAFIGQYCELPDDVVFTVEYSVRSAQTAVYSLLDLDKEVSPLYKAQHDVGVLFSSLMTMFH